MLLSEMELYFSVSDNSQYYSYYVLGGVQMAKLERPMSPNKEFLDEKSKIDNLLEKGFKIASVEETLSGALLEFTKTNDSGETEKEQLKIENPDTRKYFSTILFYQNK